MAGDHLSVGREYLGANVGLDFSTNAESFSIPISTNAEQNLYQRRAVSPLHRTAVGFHEAD